MEHGMNSTTGSSGGGWSIGKILLGIGVGCLALVLFFVVVAIGVGYWAYMPGNQVATSTILSDDSVAFLRVQTLGKDPGVSQLLETVIVEARKAEARNRRNLPIFLRWMMDRQVQGAKKEAGNVREMLAREVTVTLESVPDQTDPRPVIAVNLSRFPRLIRFFWWLASDGNEAQVNDESLKLGFVENTMILAPPTLLPRVAARLEGGGEGVDAGSEIFQAYQSANPRWDVHGLALNRGNAFEYLRRAVQSDEEEDLLAESLPPEGNAYRSIRKIRFGVDVVSDDEIEAQIALESDDPAAAREVVEKALQEFREAVSDPDSELRSESSIDQQGDQTVLSLRISNLRQVLIRAIRERGGAEESAPSDPATKR